MPLTVLGRSDIGEEVKTMTRGRHKPGERAPDSGIYRIVGPRGGETGESERTVVEGEPFPPTPDPGQMFEIVRPARHPRR